MHDLVDLFHKIYDVQGIITWGGLAALVLIIFAETGLLSASSCRATRCS